MLAHMVRRLSLTGLLMASLVGTGMLFGSAGPNPGIDANVAETAANVVEITAETFGETSSTDALAVPATNASGSDLRWPFFTFGRKRSGPSW